MALFEKAFARMIENEGGYVLHEVTGDTGGQTYAGISRNNFPDWPGWALLAAASPIDNMVHVVKQFYIDEFWSKIRGDQITSQIIANSVYDFAVNAGVRTATKIAQRACNIKADGFLGPVTRNVLNAELPNAFLLKYKLAKIRHYANICNRKRSQSKFLLGWINRTLKDG